MSKVNRMMTAFHAGFVRRWHTNADMAHIEDRIDAHSGRVARIILMFHPNPSVRLLRMALTHDDGEYATGDMSSTLKDADPALASMLADVEAGYRAKIWGPDIDVDLDGDIESDKEWLWFADRLDAYMWVAHHKPHALSGDGWPRTLGRLMKTAQTFGGNAEVFVRTLVSRYPARGLE